ncbi:MAG: uL15 family ribosomal protein [Candidatus Hodarchaeales archaeon]|jgi:large subunit ribosomal protein L15
MVVRRNKKVRKQRGSRVHGYGRISGGHRKSGSRGGVGKSGRKAHHWIQSIIMGKREEKRGFIRHGSSQSIKGLTPINIQELAQIASKSIDKISEIDIRDFGYNKVLGKGVITIPINVKAPAFTEKAKTKIIEAGGKCIETK